MLEIPVLRFGRPYHSVERVALTHHATGAPLAHIHQANSGLIARDIQAAADDVLEGFRVSDLIEISRRAAELFLAAELPMGDPSGPFQSFDEYLGQLSSTTGMPLSYCRANAGKIHKVMAEMGQVIAGLTRGFDLDILDRGFGRDAGRTLSFYRAGRIFGAVLPSNSPGVHSLWIPAFVLKAPIVLKPGREEPWTPLRIIAALIAAGAPSESFAFYPTDHSGANEVLRLCDRSMLFGDTATTARWRDDPRVELHGPGFSKVLLGPDAAPEWQKHLDLLVSSIAANGGRSCINASGVWTPSHGDEIAAAIAEKFARIDALPADDARAELAAFANPAVAEGISAMIDQGLREPGACDITEIVRAAPRLARRGRVAYLLPTVVHVSGAEAAPAWEHSLANREFLFPFASVVECPLPLMPTAIGKTLVATAITRDNALIEDLMASGAIDRLNIGPIPTWRLSWDQPHEGNLFEHLYRQRAFQIETAA